MEKKNKFCQGILTYRGIRKEIGLAQYLYSDIELNPPKSIFKKMAIKDSEKNYKIPSTVSGCEIIGMHHSLNGWSHHGYYSIPDTMFFVPISFFNVTYDNKYGGSFLPNVLARGKWRLDFFKYTVVSNGIDRILRYQIKGGEWTYKNDSTGEMIEASDFSIDDAKAKRIISTFAGSGSISIKKYFGSWSKETLSELSGWCPCFVREEIDGPFEIEFHDYRYL